MRDDQRVPRRHSPPTPRSAKLGKELRMLREARGLTMEQVANLLQPKRSQSWMSRVEKGLIKLRPGDVTELLLVYEVPPHLEGKPLVDMARTLGEAGWWQRLDALPMPLLQLIGFEAEAERISVFETILVPGLFQTEDYARSVISIGRETEPDEVQQRVEARANRQEIIRREPHPPYIHAVISDAVLQCEVGGPAMMADQILHIVELASLPNVSVQVLRFQAGAHLADRGAFNILGFGEGDPDLGFVDTVTGSLFLEAGSDIDWLNKLWRDIVMRSMSPAESVRYMNKVRHRYEAGLEEVDS